MPGGNFVLGLPAGPAGGVSRRGPAAGLPSRRQSFELAQRYAHRRASLQARKKKDRKKTKAATKK